MANEIRKYTIGGRDLELRVSGEAFQPTTTTQKIAEAVEIPEGATVLDIGCGIGPLTITAALRGAKHVYAVDVMPQATALARENADRNGVGDKVTVLTGDLFEPVKGMKFDVIVDDVSGIAERASRISTWYPDTIPTGGDDGTDVVLRMIENTPQHLTPTGVLYLPVASLSNVPKIMEYVRKVFGDKIDKMASWKIPFCPELMAAEAEMQADKEAGKIDFEERRSRRVWTLDLFRLGLS